MVGDGLDLMVQQAARTVTVEDSPIFIEISVQKSKDATWVQTSAKPAIKLECAERISPELRAISHGSNGALFNLWKCITCKKTFFGHEKNCLTLKLGFHGLIR